MTTVAGSPTETQGEEDDIVTVNSSSDSTASSSIMLIGTGLGPVSPGSNVISTALGEKSSSPAVLVFAVTLLHKNQNYLWVISENLTSLTTRFCRQIFNSTIWFSLELK